LKIKQNNNKSLVRPHLEYANTVWAPRRMCDIKKIEKVQMTATKLIGGLSSRSYEKHYVFCNCQLYAIGN